MKRKLLFILIIVLLCLSAVWSLFHPGFFPSHDGEWMVIRLSDFHRSFVSGQIPVRWAARLNHGFGYPVFNFLYPLSLYFGEFFYFFTGSFVNSIKLVFISSFLLSAIFMYLWIRELWGDLAGLISAIFYVYAPYRFLDVYVRGSLGEAVAFVFPPLIFWMADRLVKKGNKFCFIGGGLAFAGLITAHNTMAMLFTLVFLVYLTFRWLIFRQNKALFRQLVILFLGLGLSCFFWLPALYDKQYVFLNKVMVSNFFLHFPTLRQLLVPSWGYGPSLPLSDKDPLSFQVGIANLAVFVVIALALGLKLFRSPKASSYLKKNFKIFYFLFVFIVSFFLMLEVSFWVWRVLFVYNLIQFPWRLLSLTTFAIAFLAGTTLSTKGGSASGGQLIKATALVILVILLNYNYAKPEYFVDRGEEFYATNEATTTVQDEYMPIWVQEKPTERAKEKAEIVSGEGAISNMVFNSKKVSFDVEAETELEVQMNIVYFPGWKVKVDSKPAKTDYQNKQGLIRFKIQPGKHQVVAEFGETPVRFWADIISLASLVLAGGLLISKNGIAHFSARLK